MKVDAKLENQILASLAKFADAYRRKNACDLLATFAKDEEIVAIGTGHICVGAGELKAEIERDFREIASMQIQLKWVTVSTLNGVAWVATNCEASFNKKGKTHPIEGRFTAVLKQQDSEWLIVQTHFSFPY